MEFLTFDNIIFFIIVAIAKAVEAIAGFGSTIIAVTLGTHIYSIDFLVPVLVPPSIVLSAYIVARHRKELNIGVLFKRILPFAIIGLAIGVLIFNIVQGRALKIAYGVFVIVFSVFELYRLKVGADLKTPKEMSLLESSIWLISGGIMQGIYASGGPMIVYFAGRTLKDKGSFRCTLSALWLILNIILCISHLVSGKANAHTLAYSAALIPAVIIGIIIGEFLHKRIPERPFRYFVYILLIVAGVAMLTGL